MRIDPKDPDQRTVLAGGLEYPLGLAVDAGNLYVGDFLRPGKFFKSQPTVARLTRPNSLLRGCKGLRAWL